MPTEPPSQAKFVGQSSFVDFGKIFLSVSPFFFIHVVCCDVCGSESPLNFALLLWGLGGLFPETQNAEQNWYACLKLNKLLECRPAHFGFEIFTFVLFYLLSSFLALSSSPLSHTPCSTNAHTFFRQANLTCPHRAAHRHSHTTHRIQHSSNAHTQYYVEPIFVFLFSFSNSLSP